PYDNINSCAEAPDACLGVPYYNWGPKYLDTIQKVKDGTWEAQWEWLPPTWDDLNNPETSIVGFMEASGLSEEAKAQLDAFYQEMVTYSQDPANENTIFLWTGPLNLQDGTELAAEGESVDPMDVWFLPKLLEGMGGASE
ncbi:MAG: BMP family ABC transporter substrate-binding protein, partial [Anaerolineae bacterium]|nr:BMP family ABC transporter substrate-binding protein [Anaerolineae bacterium]